MNIQNQQQQRELAKMSKEKQFVYTMMMLNTNDYKIPPIQVHSWVTDLGNELKHLIDNNTINRIWFDNQGDIRVETKN